MTDAVEFCTDERHYLFCRLRKIVREDVSRNAYMTSQFYMSWLRVLKLAMLETSLIYIAISMVTKFVELNDNIANIDWDLA